MMCAPRELDNAPGFWQCSQCGYVNHRESRSPFKRKCSTANIDPRSNLASIQTNGPTRTSNEVLVIITNFCEFCPAWNPAAEKKKCKYCGCGSSDTVENLHKRRIRNCPKGHWTEASLQKYLHPNNTSSTDFEKSP